MERLEEVVGEIEASLQDRTEKEIPSSEVGEAIMRKLHDLDPVAYVRFASVYREFKDVNQFMDELKGFLTDKKKE